MFLPDVCESAANRQSYPLDAMQYNEIQMKYKYKSNTNALQWNTNEIQIQIEYKCKSANRQSYTVQYKEIQLDLLKTLQRATLLATMLSSSSGKHWFSPHKCRLWCSVGYGREKIQLMTEIFVSNTKICNKFRIKNYQPPMDFFLLPKMHPFCRAEASGSLFCNNNVFAVNRIAMQ